MQQKTVLPIIIVVTGIALLCVTGLLLAGAGVFTRLNATKARKFASLGDSYYHDQQMNEAIVAYSKSLTLFPRQPTVWYSRGCCYFSLKKYEPAIQDSSMALSMIDGDGADNIHERAGLYFMRGCCYMYQHEDRRAIADDKQFMLLKSSEDYIDSMKGDTARDLAWLLATSPDTNARNGEEALRYAQFAIDANRITVKKLCDSRETPPAISLTLMETLAAAEARACNYPLAVTDQLQVIAQDQDNQLQDKQQHRQRLLLYQQGKPYTEDYIAKIN